jgi:hypothetical protein
MAKKRLPPITSETVDEFKRKVHLAFPGELGAFSRETEKAIKCHEKELDKHIADKADRNHSNGTGV